ncbi:MAG: hypothetical protein ACP5VS_06515 [Desulfomonilaceae bacterium]
MILASKESIDYYTSKGCWGSKTLLDHFYEHVAKMPDKTAVVDPLNKETLLGTHPDRISYAELSRAIGGMSTIGVKIRLAFSIRSWYDAIYEKPRYLQRRQMGQHCQDVAD